MKQSFSQFLLLDLGHPMSNDTIKLLKMSLKNVLTLASGFSGNFKVFCFGISVINSEFLLIELTADLAKNYNMITAKLDNLDNISNVSGKITVKEYKVSLKESLEKIFLQLENQIKKIHERNVLPCIEIKEIKITVITKKTASILRDILMDVMNKLPESIKSKITVTKKIEIIQIINDEENTLQIHQKNHIIELLTCGQDMFSLESALKNWLLKSDSEKQIGIVLSDDIHLVIKCDIEDCIINPQLHSCCAESDLWDNILFKTSTAASDSVTANQINNLKVVNRVPLVGVCPTLVFGVPRRLYASSREELSWNELEVNRQIFKELCEELLKTQQGLITKSELTLGDQKINTYYFITSGGDMLLLSSLASYELQIAQRQCWKKDVETDSDPASVVQACLRNIKFEEEYSPDKFPSRIYDYLTYHLMQTAEKSSFLGNIDPTLKSTRNLPIKPSWNKNKNWSIHQRHRTTTTLEFKHLQNKEVPEFKHPENVQHSSQTKKRPKEVETGDTHPALLPPQIVKKYRKGHPSEFVVPELSKDYNDNLTQ